MSALRRRQMAEIIKGKYAKSGDDTDAFLASLTSQEMVTFLTDTELVIAVMEEKLVRLDDAA